MTKASDNTFPSILITEGTEPSAPAAGKQRLYIDSTTHALMLTNSSGTESAVAGSAGSVATDALWDAAGDLAVGSGANTAAKLVKGAAGGFLSMINSVVTWNSGTSMPGTAVAGDRYWRTDLGVECYYDGTRWLGVDEQRIWLEAQSNVSATGSGLAGQSYMQERSIYVTKLVSVSLVLTTNDAGKFWTPKVQYRVSPSTATDLTGFTYSTGTGPDTAGTQTGHVVTPTAVTMDNTMFSPYFTYTKTSTPGNLYLSGYLVGRFIYT